MRKKGGHFVGVAPQYASSLSKNALSDAGLGDAGITRGASDGWPLLVAGKLDQRS